LTNGAGRAAVAPRAGSSITQQLGEEPVFFPTSAPFERKVKEAFLAVWLENTA